jgi:hypothetical protein
MENDDDEEEEGPTNVVRFGTVFLASLVAFLFFVLDDLDEDLVLEDLEDVLEELEEGGVVFLLKKVSMGRPDEEGDGAVAVAVVLEGRLGLELLSLLFLLVMGDLEVAVVSSSFTALAAEDRCSWRGFFAVVGLNADDAGAGRFNCLILAFVIGLLFVFSNGVEDMAFVWWAVEEGSSSPKPSREVPGERTRTIRASRSRSLSASMLMVCYCTGKGRRGNPLKCWFLKLCVRPRSQGGQKLAKSSELQETES